MSNKVYLEWENVNKNWEDVDQVWEDVILLEEIVKLVGGSSGLSDYVRNNPWRRIREQLGEEKSKKFIKIFARVNDLSYDQMLELNDDVKIKVTQMQKVFEYAKNIGVKITF